VVVIGIIALLAGMIASSLWKARKLAMNVVDKANRRGLTYFRDTFEGQAAGTHPDPWTEMTGSIASDVVTKEWGLRGGKAFVSTCRSGGWVNRAVVDLSLIGVWPLTDYYFYDAYVHFEATRYSSGALGFTFWDPRNPSSQVPFTNGVCFGSDGQITWAGKTSTVLRKSSPGTASTFRVRVEVDTKLETADVWITEVDDSCANALKSEAFRGLKAWPHIMPASSPYGKAVPLKFWGFGMNNWWDGSRGPGRVFIDDLTFGETYFK
jgi:hypothetical protein